MPSFNQLVTEMAPHVNTNKSIQTDC